MRSFSLRFLTLLALFTALASGCGTDVAPRGRAGSTTPDQVDTDTGGGGGGTDATDTAADTVTDTAADTATDTAADTATDTAADTTVGCTGDLDCRGGELCRDGQCREACGPADPCTGDLSVCDPEARICVGCATATDCAAAESCIEGTCRFVCDQNADCEPGQRCDLASGSCVAGCDDDIDCPGGQRCQEGTCVAIAPQICSPFASACEGNNLLICRADGSAFDRSPGPTGTVCSASAAGAACEAQICAPGTSSCFDSRTLSVCAADGLSEDLVACTGGGTCSAGVCRAASICTPNALLCDGGDAYRCNAAGTATSLVDTCSSTEICTAGACVSTAGRCSTGLDCPALPTSCDGNVRVSFRAGGACVGGTCDYSAVQRRTNCELTGQVCDEATASCVEPACPLTEADCPFSIPLLDPIACACVACLSNGDCGSGQSCSDGTCVGGGGGASDCTNDTQCEEAAIALGGTGTGAACDLDTNSCFTLSTCNGAAGGTDIFNADCPSGTTCQPNPLVGSKCAGCTSSSQCRTGETCYDCATTTVCSDASGLGPLGAFFCTPL
jgi:hypothetical protein